MADLTKRDLPGLLRLLVQGPLLVAGLWASVTLGAQGHPAAWLAALVAGVALLCFFPSLHEAGHGAAFRARWLNEAVAWPSAVLMLQSPTFFREFHWAHHRHTQDPLRDPEIAAMPALLSPFPKNPLVYVLLASGQSLLLGKAAFTLGAVLTPGDAAFARLFPWVRSNLRARVRWESALVVLVLGGAVTLGLLFVPGFAWALLAWPIAHLLMGLFVMAEHTGLSHEGGQLQRTRSTRSNGVVRFLMWNMNLHSEHHAQPAVPFHALPALQAELGEGVEHQARGYLAFHLDAIRRAMRLGANSPAKLLAKSAKAEPPPPIRS